MHFFRQKLLRYKQITKLTYIELGEMLDCPESTLRRFLSDPPPTSISVPLQEKFESILLLARENLEHINNQHMYKQEVGTLFPELFAPRLTNVSYLYSHLGIWRAYRGSETPVLVDKTWVYSDKEGSVREVMSIQAQCLDMPRYPKDFEKHSVIRQTPFGWELVADLERTFGADELLKNGRWHIPGNRDIPLFTSVLHKYLPHYDD